MKLADRLRIVEKLRAQPAEIQIDYLIEKVNWNSTYPSYLNEKLVLRFYDSGYGADEVYDVVCRYTGNTKHVVVGAFGGETLEQFAAEGLDYFLQYPFA